MSNIEWTDRTWNPVTGCTRVSAGCDNCYAVKMTRRLEAMKVESYAGLVNAGKGHFNGTVRCHEDVLDKPLRWRKPRKVFVNSMADLFHEAVPFAFIDKVFAVMALSPRHTFQILTKRPERMAEYMTDPSLYMRIRRLADGDADASVLNLHLGSMGRHAATAFKMRWWTSLPPDDWPLPNVWLGTSVEDQATADARIPHLLSTPAAVRFISYEPALGPVDFFATPRPDDAYFAWRGETGCMGPMDEPDDYIYWMKKRLDWLICGGESGPGARPMHPDWARAARDACKAAGVAFFFKQWGEWGPVPPGTMSDAVFRRGPGHDGHVWRVGKKASGRLLDGREHNDYPASPKEGNP